MPKAYMNHSIFSNGYLPTILIARDYPAELVFDSPILASFNQVYAPIIEAMAILAWVQQHQPDLIILDIQWSKIVELGLITTLRLDWLTRNIPIVIIGSLSEQKIQPKTNLDGNAYLTKPYSTQELEKVVCSLVPCPACKALNTAS